MHAHSLSAGGASSSEGPRLPVVESIASTVDQPDSPHAVRFAPLPASHSPSATLSPATQGFLGPSSASLSDEHPLHNTSSTFTFPPPLTTAHVSNTPATPPTSEMFLFDASNDHIEIVVPSDVVVLRGVGNDVEPTILRGQVVLRLSEDTTIREINLNFSGKAKLAQDSARAPSFRQPVTTQTVASHDWSFLEGPKGHKHTLKAGQHSFPFHIEVTDAFPPSVSVGNANITYRLRATVVRSSFSSNWVAQKNIAIVRGFSPEALEYTQTLQIENTWPGKIMYSIMIPHKAFAAGDEVPMSLKFTPLVKGCSVQSVEATVKQYVSVRAKSSLPVQDARVVAKGNWTFQDGQAVTLPTSRNASAVWDAHSSYGLPGPSQTTPVTHALQPTASRQSSSSGSSNSSAAVRTSGDGVELGDNELDTTVKLLVPVWITPSNLTDPVTVNHKLKWSVTLSNLDGHTSELHCALPIHVLSHTLLSEARAASQQTRAVLFGEEQEEPVQTVLPSYESHVQDRIANALDLLGPTQLAPNPLHNLDPSVVSGVVQTPSSGVHTPGGYVIPKSNTPSYPGSPSVLPSHPAANNMEDPRALELLDTGLLLSLGDNAPYVRNLAGPSSSSSSRTDATSASASDSRRSSFRTSSRVGSSRTSSRATSPERNDVELPPVNNASTPRGGGLFGLPISLKPFTSLANKHSKSAAQIHGGHHHSSGTPTTSPRAIPRVLGGGSRSRPPSNTDLRAEFLAQSGAPGSLPTSNSALETMTHLLSRVPNYERATQGFLGGGIPPLDASAGLPHYDEIEGISRVHSDEALLSLRPQPSIASVYSEVPAASIPASAAPDESSQSRRRNVTFTIQE